MEEIVLLSNIYRLAKYQIQRLNLIKKVKHFVFMKWETLNNLTGGCEPWISDTQGGS